MEKNNVGTKWKVPDNLKMVDEIGGYIIATNDKNEVFICGRKVFDFSNSPILKTTMYPFTKETFEGAISSIFKLKDNFVYYVVEYGDMVAWIFKDFEEAKKMASFLVESKAHALKETFEG